MSIGLSALTRDTAPSEFRLIHLCTVRKKRRGFEYQDRTVTSMLLSLSSFPTHCFNTIFHTAFVQNPVQGSTNYLSIHTCTLMICSRINFDNVMELLRAYCRVSITIKQNSIRGARKTCLLMALNNAIPYASPSPSRATFSKHYSRINRQTLLDPISARSNTTVR